MSSHYSSKFLLLLIAVFIACSEPVSPEFEFKGDLVFVEGFASSSTGASFVKVSETVLNGNRYSNVHIEGAEVSFINSKTGDVVRLIEDEDAYISPSNFVVSIGDRWELDIKLLDGRQYISLPEEVIEPVIISDIRATYNPELLFREASEDFVPGHSISVSFDDPPNRENYYFWRFRSFESLFICRVCLEGIFRNGTCEKNPPGSNRKPFYTYNCDSECWRIRFNENIKIFADEFTNGIKVNQLSVADVLLYSKKDILVEVQQFSLSVSAYEYYKILKDLVDNNGGFNAPPPAALIGNMFNPNDNDEFVLGRFTVASTSTSSIFIDRSNIIEPEVGEIIHPQLESTPEISPLEVRSTAPCIESRFRTTIRPEGWIN